MKEIENCCVISLKAPFFGSLAVSPGYVAFAFIMFFLLEIGTLKQILKLEMTGIIHSC